MPKQVTAYLAADGSLHGDRCTAATKDIELLIAKSPLVENQPYCRKVLEWLTDDPDALMDALKEFQIACPKMAAVGKAPSEKAEGPVAHKPYCASRSDGGYLDCDCGANNGD